MAGESIDKTIGIKFSFSRKSYAFYNIMNYPFKPGDDAVVYNVDGYMEQVIVVSVGKLKKTPTKPVFPSKNYSAKPIGVSNTVFPKL